MTLIIMLILAGISLSGLIGGKGLFQRTKDASNIYNEKKAREVLETVLLTDGQFEKNINPEYNEEEFLNKLIKEEIPGSDVRGDVAIIGGEYAYDLDRSVPKIGIRGNNGYLGNPKDLVWPDLDVTVTLAEDKKDAIIKIEASEKKNGINKIEIWLLGEMIKEYTYDPAKPEITENYTATQNGKYTIKAYGELMDSKTVEVDGIVASVKFEPNGDSTWKKSHSTTVTIQETADKVVNSKYYWSNSVTTPDDSKFPENQTFKSGDTITKNGDTGTYYLWTRLQTQSGEILKWRSEGFNFDNTGPTATLTPTPVSYSSFKLNLTAQDNESGIDTYEIFVKGVSQGKTTVNGKSATKELTITNATYGDTSCYVIVTDKVGNTTRKDITAKTLMDTTPPSITALTTAKYSETGITLSATASDKGGTGVVKFEFYVDNVLKSTLTCSATTSSVTKTVNITGLSTGNHNCEVRVYDEKNNRSAKTILGTTKLYTWIEYEGIPTERVNWSNEAEGRWSVTSDNQGSIAKSVLGESVGLYRISVKNNNIGGLGNARAIIPNSTKIDYNATFYSLSTGSFGFWTTSDRLTVIRGYCGSLTYGTATSPAKMTGSWDLWRGTLYIDYEKGEEIGTVLSENKEDYPNNGVKGKKWYVYNGIEK